MNDFVVVGLRDKVAMSFQSVTLDINEFVAKRNFAYAVNNAPDLLFKSKDLELYKLAYFDSFSGKFDIVNPMELICRGDEVINYDKSTDDK